MARGVGTWPRGEVNRWLGPVESLRVPTFFCSPPHKKGRRVLLGDLECPWVITTSQKVKSRKPNHFLGGSLRKHSYAGAPEMKCEF